MLTSSQNSKFKALKKLQESRARRKQKLFLVEGIREVQRAFQSGFSLMEVFSVPEKTGLEINEFLIGLDDNVRHTPISLQLFEKVATRSNSGFIIGIFAYEDFSLSNLDDSKGPLVLLDGVEKPGNVGAILRSADGAGAGGIVIVGDDYDVFNPHVIRSSLGSVFTLPIAVSSPQAVWGYLAERGYRVIAASPHGNKEYFSQDLKGKVAIVLGSEAEGLSSFWHREQVTEVKIPMLGIADSLNVSASGAILLYEVLRQNRT